MTDTNWMDRLSEYLDGTLTPEETVACEGWLASSEEGRALLADLRKVVAKAKTMPDAPVPEAVWSGISAAIKSPEATVTPIASATRRLAVSPSRRLQFSPLQMAAAAAILLGLGIGIGSKIGTGTKIQVANGDSTAASAGSTQLVSYTPGADAKYDRAIQELQTLITERRSTLDTATVRVLESSLAKIDLALTQAQRALEQDPHSTYLIDHLSRIKRKKLDLLRQGAALVQAS